MGEKGNLPSDVPLSSLKSAEQISFLLFSLARLSLPLILSYTASNCCSFSDGSGVERVEAMAGGYIERWMCLDSSSPLSG